jgi:hypothetical protein
VKGRVEVWLRSNGRWGWRYRDPNGVLPAARDFERFDDAVAAGRRAYPDAHLVELRPRLVTARVAAVVAAVALLVLLRRRAQVPRTINASRARSRSVSRIGSRSRKARSS